MASSDKRIDPFDVAALERSLNDSATRVSTIWVTFLIFALYLLTVAATVTHIQLLLNEPVKLPALNIDLPLRGFFFLAPVLFVVFHAYVLIQVILLARTAAAYNEAIDKVAERDSLSAEEAASLRQRLTNTLFAQIFAGSPREREGWLGLLLKAMAWITLAIAPIFILLTFQFAFLPYHDHLTTWTHRLLITVELAVAFVLWPLVLDAKRDFDWPKIRQRFYAGFRLRARLLTRRAPSEYLPAPRLRHAVVIVPCLALAFVSLSIASFPGEPHINLLTGYPLSAVQCSRWFELTSDRGRAAAEDDEKEEFYEVVQKEVNAMYDSVLPQFDRLNLAYVDVVDDRKLAELAKATIEREHEPYQGERTKIFRHRDFSCADFEHADFRRVDLTGAQLSHARLTAVSLEGAVLDDARLRGASLMGAQLQRASLKGAQLQGTSLAFARLEGVRLDGASLQGAILQGARLAGASMAEAQLQGAYLAFTDLQATNLRNAQLQGAHGPHVNLQGADLESAELQGASFQNARLDGALLLRAQLQGADLTGSGMNQTELSDAQVWRTKVSSCNHVRMTSLQSDPIIEIKRARTGTDERIRATRDEIGRFIERSVAGIPSGSAKDRAIQRMRAALPADPTEQDTAKTAQLWSSCKAAAKERSPQKSDDELVRILADLVCEASTSHRTIARNVVIAWVSPGHTFSPRARSQLARALLGRNGQDCAATQDMDRATLGRLEGAIVLGGADDAPTSTDDPGTNSAR